MAQGSCITRWRAYIQCGRGLRASGPAGIHWRCTYTPYYGVRSTVLPALLADLFRSEILLHACALRLCVDVCSAGLKDTGYSIRRSDFHGTGAASVCAGAIAGLPCLSPGSCPSSYGNQLISILCKLLFAARSRALLKTLDVRPSPTRAVMLTYYYWAIDSSYLSGSPPCAHDRH